MHVMQLAQEAAFDFSFRTCIIGRNQTCRRALHSTAMQAETNCVGSQDAARKPHGLTWAALLSERDDVDLDVLHLGHFMPEISPCMAPE